jgi:hypothetical protein
MGCTTDAGHDGCWLSFYLSIPPSDFTGACCKNVVIELNPDGTPKDPQVSSRVPGSPHGFLWNETSLVESTGSRGRACSPLESGTVQPRLIQAPYNRLACSPLDSLNPQPSLNQTPPRSIISLQQAGLSSDLSVKSSANQWFTCYRRGCHELVLTPLAGPVLPV